MGNVLRWPNFGGAPMPGWVAPPPHSWPLGHCGQHGRGPMGHGGGGACEWLSPNGRNPSFSTPEFRTDPARAAPPSSQLARPARARPLRPPRARLNARRLLSPASPESNSANVIGCCRSDQKWTFLGRHWAVGPYNHLPSPPPPRQPGCWP